MPNRIPLIGPFRGTGFQPARAARTEKKACKCRRWLSIIACTGWKPVPRESRSPKRLFKYFLIAGLAIGGCQAGPNYQVPQTPMPESFAGGPASPPATQPTTQAATQPSIDITRWWESFGDPELDSLIERAVAANLDLKIAVTRLQEVRAQEYVVSGASLPLVDVSAGAGWGSGNNSVRGRVAPPVYAGTNTAGLKQITWVAGFDATWEIDFFGHFARQVEAARADSQAAFEARNAVLLTVVSDVARYYITLRALELRLAVAQRNLAIQQQSVSVVTQRFNQGITNELDPALAQRELHTVESTIAPLQAAITQAQRQIAVLLGQLPQNLYAELSRPTTLPSPPKKIAPGLPVDLLRRRPDVREAERQLAASTARIGVATANLFPRVALTAGVGVQGQGLGETPVKNKSIWSVGPALYWPLLDFGTLDAEVEVQDLRTRELLYNYRRAILVAVQEVDDAIANYTAQRDRLDRLNDAIVASERAVYIATERYERGLTDYLNVLDAQRQLYDLQDQQALAEQSAAVEYIALHKALGGGWENYQSIPPFRRQQPAVIAAGREVIAPNHSQP
jgi:NodT family efflux transporter outer membrane factor (OMF) lipoprotein